MTNTARPFATPTSRANNLAHPAYAPRAAFVADDLSAFDRRWRPTYDPPVKEPAELAVEREAQADGPDLFVCWMQKAPARQLVNLKNIPVMVMAAEASYHQVYDHCTAKYLNQAGVKTEYIRLQDKGIFGNGHMVMIEKNNLDIARLVDGWLQNNLR
jgi:pimeloyl-ACP methyl ester carboxylesterase